MGHDRSRILVLCAVTLVASGCASHRAARSLAPGTALGGGSLDTCVGLLRRMQVKASPEPSHRASTVEAALAARPGWTAAADRAHRAEQKAQQSAQTRDAGHD